MQTFSGGHLNVASDGTLEVSADDAAQLIRAGWRKVGECIIDPDLYDGESITEIDKPAGLKVNYAKGSVEWEKQQEEERLARIALEFRHASQHHNRLTLMAASLAAFADHRGQVAFIACHPQGQDIARDH